MFVLKFAPVIVISPPHRHTDVGDIVETDGFKSTVQLTDVNCPTTIEAVLPSPVLRTNIVTVSFLVDVLAANVQDKD